MERARRLANRAILKRLVNGSKQSHKQARNESSLLNSSSSVSCTPSRCLSSLSSFGSTTATVLKSIRLDSMKFSKVDGGLTESQMIEHMKYLASKNKVFKSYIGMGYYDTHVPPVILRNIMQNPAWNTQYTPYQAEISQGRLESLLHYQTMITDLTGLPMSNASLLDEGTAAAEAMAMCNNILKGKKKTFIIANNFHPQTIDICKTRAGGFNLKAVTPDLKDIDYKSGYVCGVLVQYPGTESEVLDYGEFIKNAHAPFLSTSQEYKRMMPGRIIGVSVDSSGKPALRMAMQTREQHIRRDKATSNICTAQALLANMAAMYAVYHGPGGLKTIAQRVHGLAGAFAVGLKKLGTVEVQGLPFFDTVKITVSFDETTTLEDVDKLFKVFSGGKPVSTSLLLHVSNKVVPFTAASLAPEVQNVIPSGLTRESPYLAHPIFNMYHTEHKLLSEMMPVTFPNFTDIHPFASSEHSQGYQQINLCSIPVLCREMFNDLGELCTITGFDSFSLHPNASIAGEYDGLMVIRAYHKVGLPSPGFIGADVCDLNLHKTFCIPHGGGGPGMGPVGGIPAPEQSQPLGTISAAPWGSALILPVSYSYIAMMGSKGLTDASEIAILNANYMVKRLENYYPILFRGVNGTVAHEFIVDLIGFKAVVVITFPGTLMIEPTGSESKAELDRFCDALISIREEIAEIEKGKADIHNNVLKGVPHPPSLLMGDAWTKPYSREYAAFPASWLRVAKFWPSSGMHAHLTVYLLQTSHFIIFTFSCLV
ncbi:hypothetical protein POTOM_057055 [Populus tomentosa]|uniref:Glycine dehydrogenase (aminomethyl-transferring) n=1 Tax=Populus tomentosa TaxID=118781 RepID=A0A8X7Y062_POPTO|nr:hypothetical protein POTOM_057055 [Populus tomentosa]